MPVLSPPAHGSACLSWSTSLRGKAEARQIGAHDDVAGKSARFRSLPEIGFGQRTTGHLVGALKRCPDRRSEMNGILDSLQGCITVCIRAFGSANWTVQCGLTIADAGRDWRQIDSHIGSLSLRDPKAPCPFGGRTRSTAFCIGRQRRSGDHFHLTTSSWGDPHYGKEVRYQR